LVGTRVRMEQRDVELFKKKEEGSEEAKVFTQRNFLFIEPGDSAPVNIDERVKQLIVGKNKSAALRAIMGDNVAKRNPKYKEAISDGSICNMLGVKIVDSIFAVGDEPDV